MRVRFTAYDGIRLAPQVLNLELCLPCTQFSRDLIFTIIIDSDHIIYSSWSYPSYSDDLSRRDLFLRFLSVLLFIAYLLRSYNYVRKYTYLFLQEPVDIILNYFS